MGEDDIHDETVVTKIPDLSEAENKQASLIFISGPLFGQVRVLEKGSVTLGRADDASIVINDLGISRHHAAVEFDGRTAIVRDLGSTNGTFVNGKRIKEHILHNNDRIQISSSTIVKYIYTDRTENVFHEELYKMAVIDALTGANNKKFFESRLQEEFSYARRNRVPFTLLMFDIDHFKKVNDTYGHPAGDFVLSHLAQLARSIIRQEDIFARVGGEEFCIILKMTELDGARILAERLRRLVEESEFVFEGATIPITISVGVAAFLGDDCKDHHTLLKKTDTALYASKNAGRNRVTVAI